ncbi:hypothetical protein BKA62DRAFT_3049 [Auriculariales sp. MPI-PUGE-AT-0066]|nr:hypothetical protein BKA62DRAFT_3049 [Auriculariales sp. MPI-PUGE-AT-0066]
MRPDRGVDCLAIQLLCQCIRYKVCPRSFFFTAASSPHILSTDSPIAMAATARYPQQLQRPGAAQLAPPTGFRIVSESESLGGGGGGSVTSGSPYQAGAGLPAAPATPTAPAAAAYAPAPVTPKHAPAPAPAPTGPVAAPAPTYALAPAAAAAPAGFSVLSESEPVIEVHDVHDSDYDIEMFFQAHPELACALLEPYEVKALSIAAQQSAYETEGVSIMDTKNFNKTITLFAQFGFSVGIGVRLPACPFFSHPLVASS